MPFFSRQHEEPVPEPQVQEESHKRGLLGSLRRDPSPTPTNSTNATNSTFRTARSSTSTERPSRGHSLLHKFGQRGNEELDPSIVHARERLMSAENAEKEADRVLDLARREVREAREEIKRLEFEAKEEARKAKIKQYHAAEVSKRGKALGRELRGRGAETPRLDHANIAIQATTSEETLPAAQPSAHDFFSFLSVARHVVLHQCPVLRISDRVSYAGTGSRVGHVVLTHT